MAQRRSPGRIAALRQFPNLISKGGPNARGASLPHSIPLRIYCFRNASRNSVTDRSNPVLYVK